MMILSPLRIEAEALALAAGHSHVKIGGHGKVQFAISVIEMARNKRPSLIICAGACGGLSNKVKIGDVIVADYTFEHDYKVKFWQQPPPMFPGSPLHIMDLRFTKFDDFQIHVGPIASGDEDIVTKERARDLNSIGAFGVAWEGAGGARAAQFLNIPYLEIRVVTDMCGADAPQDFEKNVASGMANIAKVLKTIIV